MADMKAVGKLETLQMAAVPLLSPESQSAARNRNILAVSVLSLQEEKKENSLWNKNEKSLTFLVFWASVLYVSTENDVTAP